MKVIEQLAVKAFDTARPSGSAYWHELSNIAQQSLVKATEYIVEETKKTVLSDHFAEVERIMGPPPSNLRDELAHAINRYSAENGSNTPDFVLAEYLVDCLAAFDKATVRRSDWWDGSMRKTPGNASARARTAATIRKIANDLEKPGDEDRPTAISERPAVNPAEPCEKPR